MEENFNNLLVRFNEIAHEGWVRGVNNNLGSVGLTFESLLGKDPDSDIFPDYKNIEIKCSQRFSGYDLKLFSKAFDGPNLFETNDILQKYGVSYDGSIDKKKLYISLKYEEYILVNEKYYFYLTVSLEDKKIYVKIYDLEYNLIDQPYIDFWRVYEHLVLKLRNLAVVYASKKEEFYHKYFRYYKINFYELKDCETFIKLIEKGVVKLSIQCRALINKRENKQKNKGINFMIDKKDINKLYYEILEYDADSKKVIFNSDYYFHN